MPGSAVSGYLTVIDFVFEESLQINMIFAGMVFAAG
jgi:hypothetical protein